MTTIDLKLQRKCVNVYNVSFKEMRYIKANKLL